MFIDWFLKGLAVFLFRQCALAFLYASQQKPHFEVERKFSLKGQDLIMLIKRLKRNDFHYQGRVEMTDWFLPANSKDDMLRLRREESPKSIEYILTFKRWIRTESGGREREESERQISKPMALTLLWLAAFVTRGINPLTFSKSRDTYKGSISNEEACLTIDEVRDLGKYSGYYLEAEVQLEDKERIDTVSASIYETVKQVVGDVKEIKKSYRDMLEASRRVR